MSAPTWAGPDRDFDVGYVRGSVALTPSFHAFVRYASGSSDALGFDLDETELQAGCGYGHAVGAASELVAEVVLLRRGLNDFDFDRNGERLSAGVRHRFGERVEGWA